MLAQNLDASDPFGWLLFLVEDGGASRLMSAQSGSIEQARELVHAAAVEGHGMDPDSIGVRYLGPSADGDVDEAIA